MRLGNNISIAEGISQVAHTKVIGMDRKVNFVNGKVRSSYKNLFVVKSIEYDNSRK